MLSSRAQAPSDDSTDPSENAALEPPRTLLEILDPRAESEREVGLLERARFRRVLGGRGHVQPAKALKSVSDTGGRQTRMVT